MKPYLRCLKFGSKCVKRQIRRLTRINNMSKKISTDKNDTERCIDEIRKVMKSYPHLKNEHIQYIDRWFLSTYIKHRDNWTAH